MGIWPQSCPAHLSQQWETPENVLQTAERFDSINMVLFLFPIYLIKICSQKDRAWWQGSAHNSQMLSRSPTTLLSWTFSKLINTGNLNSLEATKPQCSEGSGDETLRCEYTELRVVCSC